MLRKIHAGANRDGQIYGERQGYRGQGQLTAIGGNKRHKYIYTLLPYTTYLQLQTSSYLPTIGTSSGTSITAPSYIERNT